MEQTLYERLGGKDAIGAVVDNFYDRVLADDTINHFFANTDMEKQRRHQTLFISFATGGPNQYSGGSMEKVHTGMNLQPEHFNAVAKHLAAALEDFKVPMADIEAVLATVETLRDAIQYK